MSRKAKAKAVNHQNEIRDLLRFFLCPPFSEDDIVSRPMGNPGSDIILSPEVKKVIPFSIECKRHEDKTWKGTYKKSYEQCFKDENPLLIRRKSHAKNHFYSKLDLILDINPSFFRNNQPRLADSLKSILLYDGYDTVIFENTIHFSQKQFIIIIQCLKNLVSQ